MAEQGMDDQRSATQVDDSLRAQLREVDAGTPLVQRLPERITALKQGN